MIKGRFGNKTDIGLVRASNEDKALSLIDADGTVLLCVCDGMGGYMKGDFASKIATDIINAAFLSKKKWLFSFQVSNWVSKIIKSINYSVYSESSDGERFKGMGTTLTAVLIVNNFYVLAQVGDSRCYTINNNKIKQLSEDQTYAAYLYRIGQITKEQMDTHPKRHILTNSLGIYPSISIDMRVDNYNDETFLLCSDGLYNNVDDGNIESILLSDDGVDIKINELISLANANGGSDNIGVVIWEADK